MAVFLLLIFIAVWAGVRVAQAGVSTGGYVEQSYVVRGGDTLWSIAGEHYGKGVDLRRAVFDIRQANGLERSSVSPGQALTLPYEGQ